MVDSGENLAQAIRSKSCKVCSNTFSYRISRGNDRIYCGDNCLAIARLQKKAIKHSSLIKCKSTWCDKKANRIASGWCEACYISARRNNGEPKQKVYLYKHTTPAGYVKLYKPNHPLVDSNGFVFEHRYVMYESFNGKCNNCIWCNKDLSWDKVVIDHLNENKSDNRLSNLAFSCNNCNRARGAILPFIKGLTDESVELFISSLKEYRQAVE
jgi:hypothetical protein